MARFQPPRLPFVEAHHVGPRQKPTAIVIDLSDTTSDKGAALGIATRLHKPDAPSKSSHYVVDELETYRGVWDDSAAFSNPHHSLNILVCAEAVEDPRIWELQTHMPVLQLTAKLVAQLCLVHKIKPRYLVDRDLTRWYKRRTRRNGGIIVRVPGEWPSTAFLILVKSHLVMMTA